MVTRIGRSKLSVGVAAAVVVLSAAITPGVSEPATARVRDDGRDLRPAAVRTVITVHARTFRHGASRSLLGINHHYNANGFRLWNRGTGAARPEVVAKARRAGVQMMRFPGGSVAIPYDWRRAVGATRGCQVDGNHPRDRAVHKAQTTRLDYGPDEYMASLAQLHARPFLMVPSMVSTPAVAADFVEYMNAPSDAGHSNPHGGVDWAAVRAANGHPEPYGVHFWEVGNEPMHLQSRWWMARKDWLAVRQYAFGGHRTVRQEALGRNCAHPSLGVASNGRAGQAFEMLYPPVARGSQTVKVGSRVWTEVGSLADHGPRDRVYTFEPTTGVVTFGDGAHGRIPAQGNHVHASYRSVHKGFFDFAAAMKEVDPTIAVCASWARPLFPKVTAGRGKYDCLTAHPVSSWVLRGWRGPLDGHDQMMLASKDRASDIQELRASMPARVPLMLTEFSVLKGDWADYPTWASSASAAVYMATEWATWMNLGISVATGGDLTWTNNRAAFGRFPTFVYGAEAVTREAIKPMFRQGGKVLRTSVLRNPVRHTGEPSQGSYGALVVSATRTPDRTLFVLVVNRLPQDAVRARIRVDQHAVLGLVLVKTVSGRSFTSSNDVGHLHSVRLRRTWMRMSGQDLVRTFPAASTTLLRIKLR